MFNSKVLAMAIRQRRLELNYTQEYVAYKLHMSQNAYSKLELGATAVTVSRFIEISDILETDIHSLLKPALHVA
jgi:transcriptional regulator with XRE-family HTH domain